MVPLAALLLLAAQIVGLRARVLGEALDAQGRPWAGARVALVARPVPWREDVGELDTLAVVAAADGSFAAELHLGLEYSAWAQAAAGQDAQLFSDLAEHVVAGGFVRLRAEPAPHQPLRVAVDGVAPWRASGRVPYVRAVWPTETVFHRSIALDEHGLATLPPVPGPGALVQALSGDDLLVASRTVALGPATAEVRLSLPPPALRRVAFERSDGVPLAGAQVWFSSPLRTWDRSVGFGPDGCEWRSWGRMRTTGPDATLSVQMPESDGATPAVELLVQAPGAARSRRVLDPTAPQSRVREAPDPGGPRLLVEVGPEQRLRGRILAGPDQPVSGLRVYAWHTVAHCQLVGTARTDADGRFELTGLEPGEWFDLVALTSELAPAVAGAVPTGRIPLAPVTLLALGVTGPGREHDVGDLRLDRLRRCKLTARSAGGLPAPDTRFRLYAGKALATRWKFGSNELGPGDRLGRLEFLTAVDGGGILAIAPGAYAIADWRATDAALDLALQPLLPVRGRVRNPEGKPIAGAVVMVGWFQGGGLGGGFQGRAREDLNYLALRGRSGADGGFQLGFVPLAALELRLAAWLPGWGLRSADGPLLGSDPLDELELVLPAPGGEGAGGRQSR